MVGRNRGDGASSSSGNLARSVVENRSFSLIPGLPDDLAYVVLACVPLWQHHQLKAVSRSWKTALDGKSIIELRYKLGKTEEFLCLFRDDPALCVGEVFDPRAKLWSTFPPMPCNPHTYHMSNFECVAAGPLLFVLGGSLFDSRSYPMDRPVASSSVFKYDPGRAEWTQCCDMQTPRGSFACGFRDGQVLVAGGGSRHAQFSAGGDRICEAEVYSIEQDRWESVESLQRIRAGCTGFFMDDEFWVMGGYGQSGTISGILPVDEYYSDAEVLDLKTGSWRLLEPMWSERERVRLGKVAILENSEAPGIFMLENSKLLRYNATLNRWFPEAELPRPLSGEALCRVVALDGEIYVIPAGPCTNHRAVQAAYKQLRQQQQPQQQPRAGHDPRRRSFILFQIYHPGKRTWRIVSTRPPLNHSSMNPPWGAMCVVKL